MKINQQKNLMAETKIFLYGASGHAKVICSVLEAMNFSISGIFDDNVLLKKLNNYDVIGPYDSRLSNDSKFIITIGDNKTRKKVAESVFSNFLSIKHPSAIVDRLTKIGKGTVVLHKSLIQRDVIIGDHCIINSSASIDHDCIIDNFVHIAPGVVLCGSVNVGEGTLIGAGSTILPNLNIGKWVTIGAGSIITKSIPDYSIIYGMQAQFKN